jgi:hypothetical protein
MPSVERQVQFGAFLHVGIPVSAGTPLYTSIFKLDSGTQTGGGGTPVDGGNAP